MKKTGLPILDVFVSLYWKSHPYISGMKRHAAIPFTSTLQLYSR